MPVDEDNMSIGAIVGSKEERMRLAKKSMEYVCEQCGSIENIVKSKIPPLNSDAAG
jgi:hypothetical protein